MTLFTETPTDALTKDGWAARKTYPGPGAHKERELVAGSMAAAFVVVLHSMWDLSSVIRDQTHVPCIGSMLS